MIVFPPRRTKQGKKNDTNRGGADKETLLSSEGVVQNNFGTSVNESSNHTECDPNDENEGKVSDGKTKLNYEYGGFGIDSARADALITDSLAKSLLNKSDEIIYTEGKAKKVVNVDTLSENFTPGDRVDVNILKDKSLVPDDTAYLKVRASGVIDKPLSVYANNFSLSAVKMIALTGGEAIRAVTVKKKRGGKRAKREQ